MRCQTKQVQQQRRANRNPDESPKMKGKKAEVPQWKGQAKVEVASENRSNAPTILSIDA